MSMRILILASLAASLSLAPALGAVAAPAPAPFGTQTGPAPARPANEARILGVGLSYNAHYRATLIRHAGKSELLVSGWSGSGAHAVPIPGTCPEVELRWAPRWNELAVLTRCAGDPAAAKPDHGAIWVVDFGRRRAPRKVADIPGFASHLQWSPNLRHIAFLYAPATTRVVGSTLHGTRYLGALASNGVRYGAQVQSVAEVPVAGGTLQVLTPANLYVYGFRLSHTGRRLAYTAAPAPGHAGDAIAKLYVQRARPGATPKMIVDPATAKGPAHNLHIGLLRWSPPYDTQVFFIGGSMSRLGAIGGDLYSVPASGGTPVDLISGGSVTSMWFRFMNSGSLFVSQIGHGRVLLNEYGYGATYARATDAWVSTPRMISNGLTPLAVSIADGHLAFITGRPNGALE